MRETILTDEFSELVLCADGEQLDLDKPIREVPGKKETFITPPKITITSTDWDTSLKRGNSMIRGITRNVEADELDAFFDFLLKHHGIELEGPWFAKVPPSERKSIRMRGTCVILVPNPELGATSQIVLRDVTIKEEEELFEIDQYRFSTQKSVICRRYPDIRFKLVTLYGILPKTEEPEPKTPFDISTGTIIAFLEVIAKYLIISLLKKLKNFVQMVKCKIEYY